MGRHRDQSLDEEYSKSWPVNPLELPPEPLKLLKWPKAFSSRVFNAMMMLRQGKSRREIYEKHGSVVLHQALFESGITKINPSDGVRVGHDIHSR